MRVETIQAYSPVDLKNSVTKLLADQYQPTLGIVFADPESDFKAIQEVFNATNIDIIGGSTVGEFCNGDIFEKSIVCMLFDWPKDLYKIHFQDNLKVEQPYEKAIETSQIAKSYFDNPSFITLLTYGVNGETIIEGLNVGLKKEVEIYGGMAGGNELQTYVFSNNELVGDYGAAYLILDSDKIEIEGLAVSGWQTLGTPKRITESKENIIYQIDGEPALEIYKRYFGEYHEWTDQDGNLSISNSQYPIQVIRDGVPIIRAPMQVNEEEQSLVMVAPVKEGEEFVFSVSPGFEVIDETLEEFQEFRKEHHDKTPDAVILFSCAARNLSLGPMIEEEVAGLYNLWKKPFIGYFTFGELGRNKNGKFYLYNETCSLVSFRLKK